MFPKRFAKKKQRKYLLNNFFLKKKIFDFFISFRKDICCLKSCKWKWNDEKESETKKITTASIFNYFKKKNEKKFSSLHIFVWFIRSYKNVKILQPTKIKMK